MDKFPSSTPLRRQFSGQKTGDQRESAKKLIDLLNANFCGNRLTAGAWIDWYVTTILKEEDVDQYGANISQMVRTWKRFEPVRPSSAVRNRQPPPPKDPIGYDLADLFASEDDYTPKNICRAMRFYGIVLTASLVGIRRPTSSPEALIDAGMNFAKSKEIQSPRIFKTIFTSTMEHLVGRAAESSRSMSDWKDRYRSIWEKAGCDLSASANASSRDESRVAAFFDALVPLDD
jgi:hypothetical protein